MMPRLLLAAAFITAQPLVDEDVLEPSIQNEVDHALSLVPANTISLADAPEEFRLYCATNDFFGTNSLSATAIAIKLVSAQKNDGRWLDGTNDVTAVARQILENL